MRSDLMQTASHGARLLFPLLHTHIAEVPVERVRARQSLHLAGQIADAPTILKHEDGSPAAGLVKRKRDLQAGELRRWLCLGTEC